MLHAHALLRIARVVVLTTMTLCVLAVSPLHGQADRLVNVPIGARLRIQTCTGTSLTGKFGGISGDTLALSTDSVVTSTLTFPPERVAVGRRVPVDCVRNYSVFERYGNSAGRGALVGAGIGAVLLGVTYAADRSYEKKGGAATIPGVALAMPLALLSVRLGTWIGAVSGSEQWSEPRAVAGNIRLLPSGGVMSVSVRF